jgi:hypothetical protein
LQGARYQRDIEQVMSDLRGGGDPLAEAAVLGSSPSKVVA